MQQQEQQVFRRNCFLADFLDVVLLDFKVLPKEKEVLSQCLPVFAATVSYERRSISAKTLFDADPLPILFSAYL